MGNLAEFKASQVLAPVVDAIAVVAITGTSAEHNLGAMDELQGGDGGEYITIQPDGTDVYVVFGDTGLTADETATSGDDRCVLLKDGTHYAMRVIKGYVAIKGASAGTGLLRMWRSSGEFSAGV